MKNIKGIRKLWMVGFSFFVILTSIFIFQEFEQNKELNAATDNPHLNDNGDGTYTVDHAPSPGSRLKEFNGTNNSESEFYLGTIEGVPVSWRLLWDYGDGTGLAYSAFLGDPKTDGESFLSVQFGTCTDSYTCLNATPIHYYSGNLYARLYGGNDTDGSLLKTGGNENGYIKQWKQDSSLNSPTNDNAGKAVLKMNKNMENPFLLGYETLQQQTHTEEGGFINTGHVGLNDICSVYGNARGVNLPSDYPRPYYNKSWTTSGYNAQLISVVDTLCGFYIESSYNEDTGLRLALPIVLPLNTISSVLYSPIITSFKEGKSSALKNTDIGNISTDGLGPYTVNIESSGTTDATDVDEKGTLVGAGLPLSDKFVLNDTDTTKGTATLSIGDTSLLEGTYYVKVTIKDIYDESGVEDANKVYSGGVDDPERTKSVVLKIVVDPADVKTTFTTKGSFTYGDTELSTNGTIGSLSAVANSTSIKANYQFVHSNDTLSNNSEDGLLTIDNSVDPAVVKVKSNSSLGADAGNQKAYNYDIRATNTGNNTFGDSIISFSVDPMDLTIQTLFGSTAYPSASPKEITIHDTTYKGTESFSTNPVTLPYSESLGVGSYSYMNGTSTTTPETVVGTYEMNATFPSSSADLTNNYKVVYENSFLKVKPDAFTSMSFNEVGKTTPFKPLTYGNTGTLSGEAIGDFALVTTGGTTSGTYQFVDTLGDTTGSTASNTKEELEIVNNQIKVKTGEKLKAKTYDCFVRVTTTSGISHVEKVSFKIEKRAVTIQTKINDKTSDSIELYDPLPSTLSFEFTSGTFVGTENSTPTYEYFKSGTSSIVTDPSRAAGFYELNAVFPDESNYTITKNKAELEVINNDIKTFNFSGDKATHVYGDVETTLSGILGTMNITTETGNDVAGTTYEFASGGTGVGLVSGDGLLTINGNSMNVTAGKKLNAKEYTYDIKAKTPKGLSKIFTITFSVDQRPITIQTSINGSIETTNIDVNDPLPTNKNSAIASGSKDFLVGDNVSIVSYRYLKGGNVVLDENVNKNAGTYDLDVTYSDEVNYDITKNRAKLSVNGNAIKSIEYSGQTTPYTYGDKDTTSGVGNKLGTLSIVTDTGNDQANPIFKLCNDASGANPEINKGAFTIIGNDIVVASGRLNVGSYNLYVQATSKEQGLVSSDIKTITITVNKKNIKVEIKDPSSITKKVGEDITTRTVASSEYTITGLETGDALVGTPIYQYDTGFNDLSIGSVGIKLGGLTDSDAKDNYNIDFVVGTILVTQDTLSGNDYEIVGTKGSDDWYTSDVTIRIKNSNYDEFISQAPVTSHGPTITLDTNGSHLNTYLQLRNKTSGAITTSQTVNLKIDKQVPEFELLATVDGSAYVDDQPTANTIHVALSQVSRNESGIIYYYTTNENDANTTNPKSDPDKWKALTSDSMDFREPERNTYYFKAISGAGLVSTTMQKVSIYNNATKPNPSTLTWLNPIDYALTYGDRKTLEIEGDPIADNAITYSFKDENGNDIDVRDCLSIDTVSTPMIKATSGVCANTDITLYAQVGNYRDPLKKQITVKKAPLSLEALYQDGTNYVSSISILTDDPEPLKQVEIAPGSNLVGDEANRTPAMIAKDLGSYSYTYTKLDGTSQPSITTDTPGSYTVVPSFANAATGILDKYEIEWKNASININDSNIDAKDLYELSGLKGKDDWFIQKPVSIHPKHPDFNSMSVNGGASLQTTQDYSIEGENSVTLIFDDGKGHSIAKTQIIKIDTMKPTMSIQASSGQNLVYTSNTDTEEDVHINGISQSVGAMNPSGVKYYYTTDSSLSSGTPLNSDGAIKAGWSEVTGSFSITQKSTLYFKAVSGAGVVGDLNVFIANINKPDYTQKPVVSATSDGKYYAGDGSWTNKEVVFTLSGSSSGYEVCTSNINETCTTWEDINNQGASTHTIVGDIQNQYYWFRIKNIGQVYPASDSYKVSVDKSKPSKPIITITPKNSEPIARFINTMSFGNWFKEAQRVSMSSSDSLSGIRMIRYDVYKADGTPVALNQEYSAAIDYEDANYKISAKAYDNAGNISDESDVADVFIDLKKPEVSGVIDKQTYFLPYAFVHMSDSGSGIDEEHTTQSNGTETTLLKNDTLFEGKGNVSISVSDVAGNITGLSFRIDGLPDLSTWNCNENYDAIIDNVKTQYSELKSNMAAHNKVLSEAQSKGIEDWLEEAKGICQLSEPDNNVTVESEGDRIPPNTVLVVDVVTTTIPPELIEVKEDEEIKAAYDVYMKRDGEIFKSINDTTLTVRLPMGAFKGVPGLRLIEVNDYGSVKEIDFTEENSQAVFKTTELKKYAFIAKKVKEKPSINIDIDGDGKPDINIDTDGDGIPDINIDTNGDGSPDYNVDVDGDQEADINIGPDIDIWRPELCNVVGEVEFCTMEGLVPELDIDTNGDKIPDLNVDIDNNGTADLNVDMTNDWIPDINIDSDGDGIPDINVDKTGDGYPNENLMDITSWEPTDIVTVNGKEYGYMKSLNNEPEPDPEPKPDPSPDPDPEPKPDPNPEPKPDPDPNPNPDPNPEPNPGLPLNPDKDTNAPVQDDGTNNQGGANTGDNTDVLALGGIMLGGVLVMYYSRKKLKSRR